MAGGAALNRGILLMVALLVVLSLAGCGKKGAPSPPGPAADVIYPKTYPTQ